MFCPYCGKKVADGFKRCPECGKGLLQEESASPSGIPQRGGSPIKTVGIIFGFLGSGFWVVSIIVAFAQCAGNEFGNLMAESLLQDPKFITIIILMILGIIGCIVAISNQTIGGILMLIGCAPIAYGVFQSPSYGESDILPIIATILWCLGAILVLVAPKPSKATITSRAKKYCPECGAEIEDDSAFCPQCGTRIEL